MNQMDKDGDGEITFEEFKAFEKKMSSLLYPAFNLQREMRKNIIGEGFWRKATLLRKRNAKGSDLIELNHRLQTGEALDRRALREKATQRQHGRVHYKHGAGKKLTVYISPDLKADKASRKLKWQEEIEIFSSVAGDGRQWYNMKEGGTEASGEWIQAKYIKIDHTHEKMMRKQQRVQEEDARLRAQDEAKRKKGKKSKYAAN